MAEANSRGLLCRFCSFLKMCIEGREPRQFSRVLDPVDPWIEPSDDAIRVENFRGKHIAISVAALASCPAEMVLAGFYGPSSRQIPLAPHYLRFSDIEAREAGGTLKPVPSDPPWPPEYCDAHHDLTGDQASVAKGMVELHSRDPSRVIPVQRLEVFDSICSLLARPDAPISFTKTGWKQIRRLLRICEERESLWVPLAASHSHLLDDDQTQGEFRKLYNAKRDEWQRVADKLGRVATDPLFSTKKRK